ncbi:MAG: 3-isopropylmalate dehydratase small subunit [Steroidobacteraceae bacterium]
MEPLKAIRSRTVVIPNSNIDTDQIIPARFLRTTTREGLGKQLFADWRYRSDGSDNPDFVMNKPESQGCQVLVAGNNFGCGSSREHAPWALYDAGIRAVISTEIADIFRNNSLKNGLLPVVIEASAHAWLLANPGALIEVDLQANRVTLPDGRIAAFNIEPFARYCLLNGVDELGYLLSQEPRIAAYEKLHALEWHE